MENYVLISDAAKEVEVESHVLRYWEEELNLPIHRNEQGHRFYTREDVDRFKQIKRLKEGGLQLKAIKMILKDGKLNLLTPMTEGPGSEQEGLSERKQKGNIGERKEEMDEMRTGRDIIEKEKSESQKKRGQEVIDADMHNQKRNGYERKIQNEEKLKREKNRRQEKEEEKDESRKQEIEKSKNAGAGSSLEQLSAEEKAKRLKWLLQQLIGETLQENNRQLCEEIRESVIKELDYQFRSQEEWLEEKEQKREQREEEYYQKLDELMRSKLKKGFAWKREERKKRKLFRKQKEDENTEAVRKKKGESEESPKYAKKVK